MDPRRMMDWRTTDDRCWPIRTTRIRRCASTATAAMSARVFTRAAAAFRVAPRARPARGGAAPPRPRRCCRCAAPGAATAQARGRRGWLAMAASVLVALVVAGGLWLRPGPSLAADVVTHMAGSRRRGGAPTCRCRTPELEDVLRDSHMRLHRRRASSAMPKAARFADIRCRTWSSRRNRGRSPSWCWCMNRVAEAGAVRRTGLPGSHRARGRPRQPRRAHARSGRISRPSKSIAARVLDAIVWTR